MELLKRNNSSSFSLSNINIKGDSIIGNNGKIIKDDSKRKKIKIIASIITLIGLIGSIITIYSFFN